MNRSPIRITGLATVLDPRSEWPEWMSSAHRRRVDPLTRMAAAAVDRLLTSPVRDPDTALIVSTSYGAVDSTYRFTHSVLDFGDDKASPTPFTASVHNSCAGALGEALGLHGPSTTISQGQHGTIAALRWCELILRANRAKRVLVVLGDRHNAWSRNVVGSLAAIPWQVGDGACALIVTNEAGAGRILAEADCPAHALQINGGAAMPADRALLEAWPEERRCAAEGPAGWWPCATLTAIDQDLWRSARPLRIAEAEGGHLETRWLGPWLDG